MITSLQITFNVPVSPYHLAVVSWAPFTLADDIDCINTYFVCFVCLFCCFMSQVNSYGMVSSPNYTFSWASHWYPGSGVVLDCIDS